MMTYLIATTIHYQLMLTCSIRRACTKKRRMPLLGHPPDFEI